AEFVDPTGDRDVQRSERLASFARERLRGALDRIGELRICELGPDPVDRLSAGFTPITTDPRDHLGILRLQDADAVARDLGGECRLRFARDEHAAILGPDARLRDLAVPGAAADTVASLEDDRGAARFLQVSSGGDAGKPGSQDEDVGIHREDATSEIPEPLGRVVPLVEAVP